MSYGSHHLLRGLLGSLPARPGRLVVVVDNLSTAAERSAVTALAGRHGWLLVAQPGNPGFGAGVNAGVRAAAARGARTVLLLNPDTGVDDAVVEGLLADAAAHPRDLVAPVIRSSAGRVVSRGHEVDRRTGGMSTLPVAVPAPADEDDRVVLAASAPGRTPWLTGAAVALSTRLHEDVGGLAEDYFLYWEDVDLSLRVLAAGGRLVLRRDLGVVHDEGGTQGERSGRAKSDLYYRYNCRNRLVFAQRWLEPSQARRWLVRTPAQSRQIWLRGGRRQLLTSPGGALAAVRGSVEGAAEMTRAMLRRRS